MTGTLRRFRCRTENSLIIWLLLMGCARNEIQTSDSVLSDKPPSANDHSISLVDRQKSHQEMLERIAEIASRTNDENPVLGNQEARTWRDRINQMGETTTKSQAFRANYVLAWLELRLGHEREAIQLLNRARELLPENIHEVTSESFDELIFALGVAHLRLGETENCCQRNTPDSCILPIRGGGVHTRPEGSQKAIEYFQLVLERTPPRSTLYRRARWLANIAYMTLGKYPQDVPRNALIPPQAFAAEQEFPRFPNIARNAGVDTFSVAGGAVAEDFDGDGWLDLMVSTSDMSGQLCFFHNRGDGTFEDRTVPAGLQGINGGFNLVQGDYNNDGYVDVYLMRGAWLTVDGSHPNSLLRNNGDGTFVDVTFVAGLGEFHYPSQTAAWSDYDNDGDLDLYVGNETTPEVYAPCQLFRNDGSGTFRDVATEARVTNERYAKGVVWGDYNGDRWPDLFVSNFGQPNRLYHNNGDGSFTDVAIQLGVAQPSRSFPAWFWDYDNDGQLDLYVSAYSGGIAELAAVCLGQSIDVELNRLFRGDGKGGFEDVTQQGNLARPSFPMGANFGDLDGDGLLDFYLGTGWPDYFEVMPNLLFHNQTGEHFVEVATAAGVSNLQKGHAVLFADLDHDGDVDLFEQMGGWYLGDRYHDALYENPGFHNAWIQLHLVGTKSNRSAIGARIQVTVQQGELTKQIYRHVNSGGTFGANPLVQHLGLGKADHIESIEVYWPTTDETQRIPHPQQNCRFRITEGKSDWQTY